MSACNGSDRSARGDVVVVEEDIESLMPMMTSFKASRQERYRPGAGYDDDWGCTISAALFRASGRKEANRIFPRRQ